MNRELKKLSVTAQQIGHCLLCGGVNGQCNCSKEPRIESTPIKREFIDLCRGERRLETGKQDGNADYSICKGCGSICAFLKSDTIVACTCGYLVKDTFVAPPIADTDLSVLDGLSDLPTKAVSLRPIPKSVRNVSTRRYQK